MFKINYGYGTTQKSYSSLKNAKITCRHWFNNHPTCNWLDVVEIKSVMRNAGAYRYLSTDVVHHTIER